MKYLLILIFFCLAASACGSSDNQVSKDSKNTENDTARIATDTMSVQPPPPPLSPGTAQVKVTVQKKVQPEDEVYLQVMVNQVLRHGPSTPPLTSKRTLKVYATSFKHNAEKVFSSIEEDQQFIFTIGSYNSPLRQHHKWTLLKVEKDTSENNSID